MEPSDLIRCSSPTVESEPVESGSSLSEELCSIANRVTTFELQPADTEYPRRLFFWVTPDLEGRAYGRTSLKVGRYEDLTPQLKVGPT